MYDNNGSKLLNEYARIVRKKYPNQAKKIIVRARQINDAICRENQNESRKVAMHTRVRIYPSISFYKAISEITGSKKQAYRVVAGYFNRNARSSSRAIRTICKIPLVYRSVPGVMPWVIHNMFGKESGFKMADYPGEKGKCHIDMIACPYFSNCKKYNCAELTTAFCNSDDIAYGNMHSNLRWGRTKTLGRGDECCNFMIEIRR